MKRSFIKILTLSFILGSWVFSSSILSASPSTALLRAKKDAEAKGLIFETSHDEIVAKAKKEGQLRALSTFRSEVMGPMSEAFQKKYPFIDTVVADLGSVESAQRFLLELNAGRGEEWDVVRLYTEFYEQYLPFQKKFDILGMAEQGVLGVPPKLVDPRSRNIVFLSSVPAVVTYNRTLISENKVPDQWEDFLKPEFKGRRFLLDVRPVTLAVMVPGWGLEKVLSFAKKLAAQDPVWVRGHTRNVTAVRAGEYALFLGPNYTSTTRAQKRDPMKVLGYKIVEPVPMRIHQGNAILKTAQNSYAGLLWLEFQASPEGQQILDKYHPNGASIFAPGSNQEEVFKGKQMSVVDMDHYIKLDDYMQKIVEAYGFPKVTRSR